MKKLYYDIWLRKSPTFVSKLTFPQVFGWNQHLVYSRVTSIPCVAKMSDKGGTFVKKGGSGKSSKKKKKSVLSAAAGSKSSGKKTKKGGKFVK